MKTNLSLLFLLFVVPGIQASEAPRLMPTIDFSSKTLKELAEYRQSNNLEALTPRSKQSYTDRFKALANQRLNDFRAQLGITPEMMAQGEQQPTMSVIIIIPAAAGAAGQGHAGGHGAHGPNCICHLLDQLMPREGAQDDANREDMATDRDEDAAQDEESTADALNARMKNMNFNRKQ